VQFALNIIRTIKKDEMGKTYSIHGENMSEHRVLVGKPEG
jgi:hypothetical protein